MILEVGSEGGSIVLYGVRTTKGWQFSRKLIDQSLQLLDEAEIRHDSKIVDTWLEALELLDRYRWQHLSPVDVHPEFRGMILEAVLERYKREGGPDLYQLPRWEKRCSVVGGEPTICTSQTI